MTPQEWAAVFAIQLRHAERVAMEYTILVGGVAANGWFTVAEYEHQQEVLVKFQNVLRSHRQLLAREAPEQK
jgi:hypothetical protein